MDIKTLLDNLHEEVSCSVCMCKYTDPKQLPCLHSFCLHCLSGIQRTSASRDKIACPECRQEFRVPGNGNLSALPTNFRINSLLDVLAIKECNTTGVKCGNCDKRFEKTFYCFQCCSFWCNDCISFHNGMKGNKNHYSLALKDFEDQDFENILKQPAFCGMPGHEKKELEFFCKNCEVAICYSCVATLHDGHAKMLLDEAANERKLHVMTAIESQKQRVHQKKDKIAKMRGNCLNIQAKVDNVKREAQTFVDNMIAAMEAKKEGIFNDVEKKAKEWLERLKIQQCETENEVKLIETAIEKTETLLKRSTNAEIVKLDKNTIFQEGVCNDGEQVDLENLRQFVFVENETLMNKANSEGIGSFRSFLSKANAQQSNVEGKGINEATVGLEAQVVVTTKTGDREQCYEEHDHVTVEIRNRQGHDCATKAQVQDNKDGTYNISYFAKKTGKCEASVKVNGEHAREHARGSPFDRQGHDCATKAQVQDNKDGTYNISYFAKKTGKCEASVKVNGEHARGSPFEVQVRPRQFRSMLCFGQEGSSTGMFKCPWGVTVNGRNEIAVSDCDNHRIQVFSSNGTHLRSFGKRGVQQGEFAYPAGIAFHNDNIIVVDNSNHRVQLFSDQGKYLGQFGGEGSLDHQLRSPHGLSIGSDGNVVVTDRDNKFIKIFTLRGQLLRKIGAEGSLTLPHHCIQHDNFLIVSDRGDHCVKFLDMDGNVVYKIGKNGVGDGEFNEPACMSVNKAGHLMVCDTGNHRVQVFEMSGKFVTKFGTEGSKLGELKRPLSIAVLTDGRIVVSDSLNQRIQILQ